MRLRGQDPDTATRVLPARALRKPGDSLENDANQIGDFANANWPSDAADQAMDIATSLYSMSFGAYGTNPNAEVTSIETGRFRRATRARSRRRS